MPTSLNLKNVELVVVGPPAYRALDRDGVDLGDTPLGEPEDSVFIDDFAQRPDRDWRKLRGDLMKLDLASPTPDRRLVADWLDRAGYAARIMRRVPTGKKILEQVTSHLMPLRVFGGRNSANFYQRRAKDFPPYPPSGRRRAETPSEPMVRCVLVDLSFSSGEYVTDGMLRWLRQWQEALKWAMEAFDPKKFQKYAWRARLYEGAKSRNSDQQLRRAIETGFILAIGAPKDLPADFLKTLILGLGSPHPLRGGFQIDEQGRPRNIVFADTAMVALTITVLLDRIFTKRGFGRKCKYCGTEITSRGANQKFCGKPKPCQNRWNTELGRARQKAIKIAKEKAPRKDAWKWIAGEATRALREMDKRYKDQTIAPEWARKRSRGERTK